MMNVDEVIENLAILVAVDYYSPTFQRARDALRAELGHSIEYVEAELLDRLALRIARQFANYVREDRAS